MQLRGLVPATHRGYLRAVRNLAGHCGRSPETATAEEVRQYLVRLKEAAGEDLPPQELLSAAMELQRLARRVRDAQEELEGQHPDLMDLVTEIEQLERASEDAWSFDAIEVEKRRDRLQEVQQELEERREEKGRLETEIESARGQVSVGELDGEIARIEEEMDETARQRPPRATARNRNCGTPISWASSTTANS